MGRAVPGLLLASLLFFGPSDLMVIWEAGAGYIVPRMAGWLLLSSALVLMVRQGAERG